MLYSYLGLLACNGAGLRCKVVRQNFDQAMKESVHVYTWTFIASGAAESKGGMWLLKLKSVALLHKLKTIPPYMKFVQSIQKRCKNSPKNGAKNGPIEENAKTILYSKEFRGTAAMIKKNGTKTVLHQKE